MRVFLTGATGFIGSHVARSLLARGHEVRALVRPGRPLPFEDFALTTVDGDLRDRASIDRGIAGCDGVVHVAALYAFWPPDPAPLLDVNVKGTRNVLEAAIAAGAERIVYTSTVGTVHFNPNGIPADESSLAQPSDLVGPYKRTKYEAERIARRLAAQGAPIVIVNPTAPVGPGDVRPTPTGQVIVNFLRGAMPAYVDTGLNLIDVADVAEGHALALEHGTPGQRYILGNAEGNVTLQAMLEILAKETARPAPRRRVPYRLALAAAYVDHVVEGMILGREPRIPLEGTRMAATPMWADPSKAVRELGLPQSSVKAALSAAAAWFAVQGYTDRRRGTA
jgi:dihydroflavonol-4-reductase